MNRQQAKELRPIIQAYSEGKTILVKDKRLSDEEDSWSETDDCSFNIEKFDYRIKPKPRYRPFANAEECWQEMQRHQPFGVVKDKYFANYQTHRAFTCLTTKGCYFRGFEDVAFESSFKNLLFADGLPFGVKVEE